MFSSYQCIGFASSQPNLEDDKLFTDLHAAKFTYKIFQLSDFCKQLDSSFFRLDLNNRKVNPTKLKNSDHRKLTPQIVSLPIVTRLLGLLIACNHRPHRKAHKQALKPRTRSFRRAQGTMGSTALNSRADVAFAVSSVNASSRKHCRIADLSAS
jgi:hypothetical protein